MVRALTISRSLFPDEIAGVDRIRTDQVDDTVDQLRSLTDRYGVEWDAAIYGDAGAPAFIVFAVDAGATQGQTADAIFQELASGLGSGDPSSFRLGPVQRFEQGDATTLCAESSGEVPTAICIWTDPELVGFVIAPNQGVQSTVAFTAAVRSSTEDAWQP